MKFVFTRERRIWFIIGLTVASSLVVPFLPALRQSQSYHNFADDRTFFGIPNFFNVVSNAGFAIVGCMGLYLLWAKTASIAFSRFVHPSETMPYAVFFIGVFFTCFGSSYYHWKPNDETLVWDRLPMTVAFMSLLAAIIMERINLKWGLRLLWPMVALGIGSIWWWRGTGNLWPYAEVQYFSILLLVLLILLFPPRYTRSSDIAWVAAFYALAKILEAADKPIYALTRQTISGHTLKHLAATAAVYWIYHMLTRRTPLPVALARPAGK